MGQFKPMVKMMTTEPSVILKLKKGGKVEKKADGGFMPMQSGMASTMPARGGMAPAASPMRPSMAARRRAMNPNLLMKKGGGASCETVEKELKEHEGKSASKAHKGYKNGGLAKSGIIKTITNKTTKMVDGDKHDSAKGTKGIKEGQPAGYATGGVIDGKPAGYKKGGKVPGLTKDTVEGNEGKFTNNNVNDGDKFDPAHGTTGVRESNAGGYKKGGSAKKAYATGGKVDDGKAQAMPKKPVSRPVANSLQSGTFKKGGKVAKYAEGDVVDAKAISDKASRELEDALNPIGMLKEGYGKVRDFVKGKMAPAGSVTKTEKSVTVSPLRRSAAARCAKPEWGLRSPLSLIFGVLHGNLLFRHALRRNRTI